MDHPVVLDYLVSDLDEQDEDNEDYQVIDETDYSDDAVYDLKHKIRQIARLQ